MTADTFNPSRQVTGLRLLPPPMVVEHGRALFEAVQALEALCTPLALAEFVQNELPTLLSLEWAVLLLPNGSTRFRVLQPPPTDVPPAARRSLSFLPRSVRLEIAAKDELSRYLQVTGRPWLIDQLCKAGLSEAQPLYMQRVQIIAPLLDGAHLLGILLVGPSCITPANATDADCWQLGTVASALVGRIRQRDQPQTKLRQEREHLVRHNRQLLAAREDERKHVSRELHDEVVQDLLVLVNQLQVLQTQTQVANGPPCTEKLASLVERTDQLLQTTRRICGNLRPRLLDVSLSFSLTELVRQFRQDSTRPSLQFRVEGKEIPASEQARLVIYRVAQESLNNIRKHSRAQQARISLKFQPGEPFGWLELVVQDDGCGFSPPTNFHELLEQDHLGLLGMHERVNAEGGELRIVSILTKGTTVSVHMPTGQ